MKLVDDDTEYVYKDDITWEDALRLAGEMGRLVRRDDEAVRVRVQRKPGRFPERIRRIVYNPSGMAETLIRQLVRETIVEAMGPGSPVGSMGPQSMGTRPYGIPAADTADEDPAGYVSAEKELEDYIYNLDVPSYKAQSAKAIMNMVKDERPDLVPHGNVKAEKIAQNAIKGWMESNP
jgi:hypothetical protein